MGKLKTYKSDDNLYTIFELASDLNGNLKILRFAAHPELRNQIINLIDPTNKEKSKNNFIKILNSNNIKKLEILLINPFSDSFLRKLDAENQSNYNILRIRNQMIKFVEGFYNLAKRQSNIFIGLHSNHCIWNLGIVESENEILVNVRSYGSSSQYIGHDHQIDELSLKSGDSTQLAESFLNYFNSLKIDKNTNWISNDIDLNRFKSENVFPSLFKGNVVLNPKEEKNETNSFSKLCVNSNSNEAEFFYYKLDKTHRNKLTFFSLPCLSTVPQSNINWIGKDINNIEYISGFRVFDLMHLLHQMHHNELDDNNNKKTKDLILFFLDHSLNALKEFRGLELKKIISFKSKPYPYDLQLLNSLNEVTFLLNQYSVFEITKVKSEFQSLGTFLKKNSKYKFRDAQLKNRLIRTQKNEQEHIEQIKNLDIKELKNDYNNRIIDIDFETTIYNVTEWDDVCHIFLFENTGILSFDLDNNITDLEKQGDIFIINLSQLCNVIIDDYQKILLWKTVLARSIREYFRRLWYANIMPRSYEKRYSKEGRDYYLELALFALIQTKDYPEIQKLLNYFQHLKDSIWNNIKPTKNKKIIINQDDISRSFNTKIVEDNDIIQAPDNETVKLLINIQKELIELRNKSDKKETFLSKANEIVDIKPSILGFGLNINALIEYIFLKK